MNASSLTELLSADSWDPLDVPYQEYVQTYDTVLASKYAASTEKVVEWLDTGVLPVVPSKLLSQNGGVELVSIPAGRFLMGTLEDESPYADEVPIHEVVVAAFDLGRYPVTNALYAWFLEQNPDRNEPGYWADTRFNRSSQPVVGVSFDDAQAFAVWAGGRLATEAEWEYACRAGTTGPRYADDPDQIGWYRGNSDGVTHSVGQKSANSFSLHDMLGNRWEWVADCWHENYVGAPADGSAWLSASGGDCDSRVLRGGSFYSSAGNMRSAIRIRAPRDYRSTGVGFRLARTK